MRRRKTPDRIRHDGKVGEGFLAKSPIEAVRLTSLEGLDLVLAGLDSRFDAEDLKLAAVREQSVLKALSGGQLGPC